MKRATYFVGQLHGAALTALWFVALLWGRTNEPVAIVWLPTILLSLLTGVLFTWWIVEAFDGET